MIVKETANLVLRVLSIGLLQVFWRHESTFGLFLLENVGGNRGDGLIVGVGRVNGGWFGRRFEVATAALLRPEDVLV